MQPKMFKRLLRHYKNQSAIAAAAGVSRTTVTNWKTQANGVSAKAAIALSRDCNIKASDLCGDLK